VNVNELVIECKHVCKRYRQGDSDVIVLNDVNLSLERGKSLAIMGASGSGKSTLLNLFGGLDRPTEGEVRLNGKVLSALGDRECAQVRNREIGFVYQLHHLLMEFSAMENVMMPLWIRGEPAASAEAAAQAMLARVGLAHRLSHRPSALSGGERQRVAIARALVTQPSCVLMDEPTGNLDAQTAEQVLALILELQQQLHLSFIVVTHDAALARSVGPVVELKNGHLLPAMENPGYAG
jgi:lipoprotein-releasing system ATP-binding protein